MFCWNFIKITNRYAKHLKNCIENLSNIHKISIAAIYFTVISDISKNTIKFYSFSINQHLEGI